MSAITIDELKSRPASQWFESGDKGEVIITSDGKPVAVMLPVSGSSVEPTLAAIRSLRAIQAQSTLQNDAVIKGTANLSSEEIEAEIAAVRNSRRKK